MSLKRCVVSALGIVAVAVALTGCSIFPVQHSGTTSSGAIKPVVGDCWNASVSDADEWADWKGGATTPCAASHTLYTYHVGAVAGEKASSWAGSGGSTSLSPSVQTKAAHACDLSALLPNEKWNQQLIQAYFFVPTEAQWKAGARWVRCDVGLLATGTTLDNESFRALPRSIASFVHGVSSDPARYELCMNSTDSVTQVGPLDNPDATIADCTSDPQWRLATHAALPGGATAAFPDDATANAESTKICAPAATGDGQVWLAYLPTKAGWAAGDREVNCWVGQKPLAGGQTA
jgi:Septum formation